LFVLQHIDSVIQLGLGVVFTFLGFRRTNPLTPRIRKVFRVCGPALLVISSLLLLKPDDAPTWHRQFTLDHVASAEFPGEVTPKESTDTMGDITVKRSSSTYDVPGKDIALFLSVSSLPEGARSMSDAQRIESTLTLLASQGGTVVQNQTDPTGPIHRLTIRQADKKATMQMALAYVGDNVYRVVASWTDGSEDKNTTDRFVQSFRVVSSGL